MLAVRSSFIHATYLAIFLLLNVMLPSNLAAQWVKTNGPEGMQVQSLASNGTLVALGTYTGTYQSSNGGSSWSSIANDIEGYRIMSLVFRGNDLYAGTSTHGIFVRRSGSSLWEDRTGTLPFAYSSLIYSLASHGTSLFASVGFGVYRSADDGSTWTKSESRMTGKLVTHIMSGNGILLATAGWDGIYKSTDGGNFWSSANNGLTSVYAFQTGSAETLFIAGTGSGFFLSTDGGNNWNPANTTFSYPNFYGIASHVSTIIVITYDAIYRSTTAGRIGRGSPPKSSTMVAGPVFPAAIIFSWLAQSVCSIRRMMASRGRYTMLAQRNPMSANL